MYEYAPLLWMAGVLLLWSTRYTHNLARRAENTYYLLSSILRPLGILLIALGWMALLRPDLALGTEAYNEAFIAGRVLWMPGGFSWTNVLCWVAVAGFTAFGIWSIVVLGFRRSLLYRKLDDGLVTSGPYALVRHPQFLAAIGVTLSACMLYHPLDSVYSDYHLYQMLDFAGHYMLTNWVLFTMALLVLSILEDRELESHFGEEFSGYKSKVPRLFPF
ncbi:MAG: hypothetical protein KKB90_08355 [Actinobacteria bacterium]|nr:hypothetical protein [Actinomycetota bacterium]MBU4218957.1 hypothetical protein [Actinomycetota bacterium]MBU4358039.1 hypothetical protein [Actinomycetota bacterium]MCG2819454.1 hypothetical protein [Actinomycetes bacterium]